MKKCLALRIIGWALVAIAIVMFSFGVAVYPHLPKDGHSTISSSLFLLALCSTIAGIKLLLNSNKMKHEVDNMSSEVK